MRRLLIACFAAALPLLSLAPPARAETALPREEVERIVRDYLMREPQLVYDAIQELQRRQEAAKAEQQAAAIGQHRDTIYTASGDPVGGNPQGDVTLVEFFDYRCGYCRSMAAGMRGLLSGDPKLRLVFKDLPILSPESTQAAKAALASDLQGRYADYHFALMQARDLTQDGLMQLAARIGLDTTRLAADMESPAIAARIEANLQLAQSLGVNGTPAFLVGDQIVPGATEITHLAQLIGEERANKPAN